MQSQVSATFEAWGGRMHVAVTDAAALDTALSIVRSTVDDVDRACSTFRDDSEIAALNAQAGRQIAVSPLMLDALEAAVRAARVTDGDVTPTVGDALVAFGFTPAPSTANMPGAPSGGAPASGVRITRVPGFEAIEIDRAAGTARVARGVRLDLGATAKALAADRAAEAAQAATGCGVLVSLMGDIALAGPAPEAGWSVRVTDDHRSTPEATGQTIALHAGGLATSSTTVRTTAGGHHVIDPATGRPATPYVRTVSVAAATCLDANTASTAAIVRGARAAAWLEALGLPARLVLRDGTVRHLAGWPVEGDDLPGTPTLAGAA